MTSLAFLAAACTDDLAGVRAQDDTADAGNPSPPDQGGDTTRDAADPCAAYCAAMTKACLGADEQYATAKGCLSFCGATLATDSSSGTRDTLACRMDHATRAKTNPTAECPIAGSTGGGVCIGDPGDGGDRGRCGAFCARVMQICTKDNGVDSPPFADQEACMSACGSNFKFDPSQPELTQTGNTLNCRQWELVLAFDGTGVDTPAYHCPHVAFPASAFCL